MNKIRSFFAIVSVSLILSTATTVLAQDEDPIKEICNNLSKATLPLEDQPSAEQKKELQGCQSMNLYYGIGVEPNYIKARQCAFLERAAGDHSVFGGSSILMMIYANGLGVKPNLDLATHLACQIDSAPLEKGGRVLHLQQIKNQTGSEVFDICDDITSGFMQGNCAQKEMKITQAKLENRMDILTANWSKKDQNQFKDLREAAQKFFDDRTQNEIDLSGTARSALQSEEQETLETAFVKALENFEKGKIPNYSQKDYQTTDAEMNSVYSNIMDKKDFSLMGTITTDQIKQTQKIWLQYRDAWIKFANIHYPQISAVSLQTWLTKERLDQLKDLE